MPQRIKNNPAGSQLLLSSDGKELLIYGVIGDWWDGNDALTLAREIDELTDSMDEINVRIHSPGGFIMEGLVVYNRLKYAGKPVNIHIDGMAASMASVIAMAGGGGGKITMPKNAWLMIHKPINSVWSGNADDFRKMADTLDGFEADITNIYMSRFTGTRDELSEMLADETWINAQDALEYGLIDEIVEPVEAAASLASLTLENFDNAPAEVKNLFGEQPAKTAKSEGDKTMPKRVNQDPAQNTAVPTSGSDEPQNRIPVPEPQDPAAGGATAADVAAAVDAALEARAKLNSEIQTLAQSVRLSEPETNAILAQSLTMDKAREAILSVVAKRDAGNQPIPHVTVSNDTGTLRHDIAAGLMVKAGVGDSQGNAFSVMSLVDIARTVLQAHGVSTHGMSNHAIATQAMHSTSDFPNILADVANKSLRAGYDAHPRTFLPFCRKVSANDFKPINRMQLGEAPELKKVNEKGEYTYGQMSDGKESYVLDTYGRIISLTRKTIINDDLDALTRIPRSFGDAAAALENKTVWGLLIKNGKMSDNKGVFHADHSNIGTAGLISEETLSEMRQKMRTQKGLDSKEPLNLQAQHLLVPAALETTAQKLLSTVLAAKTGDVNVFASSLDLVVEPLLDADSETQWYAASSYARIDTIEYAYLTGNEGVFIETENGFDVDGIKIKASLDFGAGIIDYRGLYRNAGA